MLKNSGTLIIKGIELRRTRKKYATRNKAHAQHRGDWLRDRLCQVCGKRLADEVHHIAGRNAAARDSIAEKYEHQKNWLAVCRGCHLIVDKESPAYTACAAKLLAGEFDLRYLQDLRPGRRFALSISELEQACNNLKEWKS